MRRLLFTLLCVCLLSTAAFGQAYNTGSLNQLVVFETFGSGFATDATLAAILPGVLTTRTVLFATSSNRLSRNLGVAIVNPGSTAASVTMTLRRGGDGITSSSKTITVGPRQQVAKFISELFADVAELPLDFDGSLAITSTNPVAIVGLRFRGTTFSTIPVTSLSNPESFPLVAPGVGGLDAVILPQFAAGGSWSSEIVISNTTAEPLTVRVDLFKQDGSPLTTRLNGQSGNSFTGIVIPAEGILIQENDDTGPLQVGYAIITPTDTIAPTVTSIVPQNGDTNVPTNQRVTATFTEAMDPSTINTTTFTLTEGTNPVSGSVSFMGTTATFVPAVNLAPSATYSATITTGARGADGNALPRNFVWRFTTSSGSIDAARPTVTFTAPASAATGVPINQRVGAAFSEAMDAATINTTTFTLKLGNQPVTGTVSYFGQTGTFTPSSNLDANATYTATITTGARDLAGNALADIYTWSFTTAAVVDTSAPTVTGIDPATGATGVPLNKRISATFSEAMDPASMTTLSFSLKEPGFITVPGTVTYSGLTAIFTPSSNLEPNMNYNVRVSTGARDLSGNAVASSFFWSFTTGAQ